MMTSTDVDSLEPPVKKVRIDEPPVKEEPVDEPKCTSSNIPDGPENGINPSFPVKIEPIVEITELFHTPTSEDDQSFHPGYICDNASNIPDGSEDGIEPVVPIKIEPVVDNVEFDTSTGADARSFQLLFVDIQEEPDCEIPTSDAAEDPLSFTHSNKELAENVGLSGQVDLDGRIKSEFGPEGATVESEIVLSQNSFGASVSKEFGSSVEHNDFEFVPVKQEFSCGDEPASLSEIEVKSEESECAAPDYFQSVCPSNEIPQYITSSQYETSLSMDFIIELLVIEECLSKTQSYISSKVAPCSSTLPRLELDHREYKTPALERVIASKLVKLPFLGSTWTNLQKNAILKLPRPKPKSSNGSGATWLYDQFSWICRSLPTAGFLCWPCLLFCKQPQWFLPENNDLNHKQLCEAHEASSAHRQSSVIYELKTQQQKVLVSSAPSPKERPQIERLTTQILTQKMMEISDICSETVHRNRDLLSSLVNAVCYVKSANFDSTIHDYAQYFINIVLHGNATEIQNCLRDFQGSCSEATCSQFVFKYAPFIEGALERLLKFSELVDLKTASSISLFIEDLSTMEGEGIVAVIALYGDSSARIQHWILEMSENQGSPSAVFALFERAVRRFGLQQKVSRFTYSSSLIHPNDISAFHEKVKRLCPQIKFFHYGRHNVTGMLFGALSHKNEQCGNFFRRIADLRLFFREHLMGVFYRIEQDDASHPINFKDYDFHYGFITTLKRRYSSVLKTLQRATSMRYSEKVYSQAPGFLCFLQEENTRFMVVLVSKLNSAISDLSFALQGTYDESTWKTLIPRVITKFSTIKNLGFDDIFVRSLTLVDEGVAHSVVANPGSSEQIFHEVIDTAISFFRQRGQLLDTCSLFDFGVRGAEPGQLHRPTQLEDILYPPGWSIKRLSARIAIKNLIWVGKRKFLSQFLKRGNEFGEDVVDIIVTAHNLQDFSVAEFRNLLPGVVRNRPQALRTYGGQKTSAGTSVGGW